MSRTFEITILRNDGAIFAFEKNGWRVTNLEGIDAPKIEIFSQSKGYGNGSIITGKRYDGRDIDIEAVNQDKSNNETKRAEALAFFKLDYTYAAIFEYMGKVACIENCELSGRKIENKNIFDRTVLTLSLFCPKPLFMEMKDTTKTVTPTWAKDYNQTAEFDLSSYTDVSQVIKSIKITTLSGMEYIGLAYKDFNIDIKELDWYGPRTIKNLTLVPLTQNSVKIIYDDFGDSEIWTSNENIAYSLMLTDTKRSVFVKAISKSAIMPQSGVIKMFEGVGEMEGI